MRGFDGVVSALEQRVTAIDPWIVFMRNRDGLSVSDLPGLRLVQPSAPGPGDRIGTDRMPAVFISEVDTDTLRGPQPLITGQSQDAMWAGRYRVNLTVWVVAPNAVAVSRQRRLWLLALSEWLLARPNLALVDTPNTDDGPGDTYVATIDTNRMQMSASELDPAARGGIVAGGRITLTIDTQERLPRYLPPLGTITGPITISIANVTHPEP